MIYGGAGPYQENMKSRVTYSDLKIFDMQRNDWHENDFSRDGVNGGKKRMNHASCIFGGMLIVHGGYFCEEKSLYSEFEIFDLEINRWFKVGVNDYEENAKG